MAQDVIGLLFGVEGGEDVNSGSGKIIVDGLSAIVKKINNGESKVPKIKLEFDTDGALQQLKKDLAEISSASGAGGAVKGLSDINTWLSKISDAAGKLSKSIDIIVKALPKSGSALSQMGTEGSHSIDALVERLTEVQRLISEINSKSLNVTNVFEYKKGGSNANDLDMYRRQATELLNLVVNLQNAIAEFGASNPRSFVDATKSIGGIQKLLSLTDRFKGSDKYLGDIASASTVASLQKTVGALNEYRKSYTAVIEAGSSAGAIMPDMSAFNEVTAEIEKAQSRANELEQRFVDAAENASKMSVQGSEHGSFIQGGEKTLSEMRDMCTTVGAMLDELRQKIESTFDFTTIQPDVTNIKNAIEELKSATETLKKVATQSPTQRSSGGSHVGGSSLDEWKLRQQWLEAEKAHKKEITEAEKEETAAQKKKYQELSAAIKQWVKDAKIGAKLSEEYQGISRKLNGEMTGETPDGYGKTIDSINATVDALKELKFAYAEADDAEKGIAKGDLIEPNEEDFERIAQSIGITKEQVRQLYDQMSVGAKTASQATENAERTSQNAWDKQVRNVSQQIDQMYDTISKNPAVKQMADNLRKYMQEGSGNVGELKNKFDEFTRAAAESGDNIETWGDKFKKTFAGKVRSALAGAITGAFAKYLRDIYQNVVKIDEAMTQLKIVTGATDREMTRFFSSASKAAKELGANITDVIGSIETFSRLGYGLSDATELAKYSTILSNVADVETEAATSGITSIIKGYGLSVSETQHVADVLIEVGQKYAVSASELMDAYTKSSAALSAAGTSFEKSAAIIAAGNAAVQDADAVGTALKTISARIRGAKADLDELGESADDLAEGFSKYAEEIEALTGFSILVDGTKDQYKDLYDIFEGISAQWDKLSDTSQARVAEILGGTRQLQVISSIMNNFGDAAGAYEDAMNSAGVATAANEVHLDSINGKLGTLSATFQEFSKSILDSEIIKVLVDGFTLIVNGLNKLASVADGALITIPAITVALVSLHAILLQIKTTQTFTTMVAGLKGVLAIFPAILAKAYAWLLSLKAQALGHTMTTAALNAQTAATQAATAAQEAMNATNPVGWIMLAVTAIYALVKAINAHTNAAQEDFERAKENADKQKELVAEYDSEIESLEELQKKLTDAHGSRQKLANIYSELNAKVAVSEGLLAGEEDAYKAVNAQIQDQINLNRTLRQEALTEKIASERAVFEGRTAQRYTKGDFNIDWLVPDASGSDMRSLMRGNTSALTTEDLLAVRFGSIAAAGDWLNYETFYEQMTPDQQNNLLETLGFTPKSWQDYWDAQVATAKEVFSDVINNATGTFGTSFMESVVDRLIRGGYTLDETNAILSELTNGSEALTAKVSEYYTALSKNDGTADVVYNELIGIFDEYIAKYPDLEKKFSQLIGGISEPKGTQEITVALKSAYEILEQVQGGYDGLASALTDVTSEGYLTADALSTLFKLEEDNALAGLKLDEILKGDANGYKLSETALQDYVQALITAYETEYSAAAAFASTDDQKNAISNLQTLQAVLATLAQTQEDSTDADKARREELEKEQDMYEDQLDKFGELIELRKDLLQTYKDELDYQKELEKRQRNVTSLQTKLSVAHLDTSAAGQARVRELESELKEAQEDLDDFTLEHAIDILSTQLESQYDEHEATIKKKLNEITDLLDALDNKPEVNITMDTSWVQEMLAQIEALIKEIAGKEVDDGNGDDSTEPQIGWQGYVPKPLPGQSPPLPEDWTTVSGGSSSSNLGAVVGAAVGAVLGSSAPKTRWTSYQDAADAGFGNILGASASEVSRASKQYGSYQAYLDAMYEKYMGKPPVYHTGGFVGDMPALASNEEFAKLLKGEFVTTPAQMKRFMEETLPKIANYTATGGSNEFNAPLIEIRCESVTSESLPELERVVNEAVKEIQKQLDSGMSRTGYKRTPTKRLT